MIILEFYTIFSTHPTSCVLSLIKQNRTPKKNGFTYVHSAPNTHIPPPAGAAAVATRTKTKQIKNQSNKNPLTSYVGSLLFPCRACYPQHHSIEENWFSSSQKLSVASTYLARAGTLCLPPLVHPGISVWLEFVQVFLLLAVTVFEFTCALALLDLENTVEVIFSVGLNLGSKSL